jgi:hypothetical protein
MKQYSKKKSLFDINIKQGFFLKVETITFVSTKVCQSQDLT